MRNYTPGTRGFFSRLTGSFVSSAAGRHVFGGRPKTRAANLAPTIEKLQYLYENLMSNNFFKTAVLKKNMNICKLKLHNKGFYQQIFWAVTALKFQQTLALDFPHICLQFFPGNFSRLEEKFLQTIVQKILISGSSACSFACNVLNFFSVESLGVKLQFTIQASETNEAEQVGCEELCRSRRMLSTEAEGRDLHNFSHLTKADSIIVLSFIQNISKYLLVDFLQT